jgi:hypothetical protein
METFIKWQIIICNLIGMRPAIRLLFLLHGKLTVIVGVNNLKNTHKLATENIDVYFIVFMLNN